MTRYAATGRAHRHGDRRDYRSNGSPRAFRIESTAAWEQPELLIAELRTALKPLRTALGGR